MPEGVAKQINQQRKRFVNLSWKLAINAHSQITKSQQEKQHAIFTKWT